RGAVVAPAVVAAPPPAIPALVHVAPGPEVEIESSVVDGVPAPEFAASGAPVPIAETDSEVLRQEEDERYRDVEAAPAIVGEPSAAEIPVPVRAPQFGSEPVSALERTRSAVWPLVLALGVGLA